MTDTDPMMPFVARPRGPWRVTRSVWSALLLREAMARITAGRFGWLWMLLEPLAFVVVMVAVRQLLGRIRIVVNAEFVPWLIVGLMVFFLFRDGVTRSLGAIEANQGLFAYRQVKPVDPVLVRAALDGLLRTIVLVLLLSGAVLLGYDILPFDPLGALGVWLSAWLLGLGLGLVVSVGAALAEEVGRVVRIMMLPLFLLSGVIIPVQALPPAVQHYLLYNPALHAVESLRLRFFEGYHTLGGIDLLYLYYWVFVSLALGLALHVQFAIRLRAR